MKKTLLFLCGFMGSGKTTQGKIIADYMGLNFIDLDEYISHKYQKTISDLFKESGETEFRHIETIALQECIKHYSNAVISTGGGTPCFNDNIELMKSGGIVIYLKLSALDLFHRLINAKTKRPLISDKTDEELFLYIENLLKIRESFYNQADIIADGNNIDATLLKQEILKYSALH